MTTGDVVVKEVLKEDAWYSLRHSRVEEVEVELTTGEKATRYRTIVWDEGRDPFIRQMFNDPVPALDFAERIKAENEKYHEVRR